MEIKNIETKEQLDKFIKIEIIKDFAIVSTFILLFVFIIFNS